MKNRYVLLGDLLLIPLAAFAAFAARFDLGFLSERPEFYNYLRAALIIKPLVFLCFRLYQRYWRYTTIQDIAVVFAAVTVSILAMSVYVVLDFDQLAGGFSRIVLFNDLLMTFATVAGLRLAIRVVLETSVRDSGKAPAQGRRVLVVGAGAAGILVVSEMRRNPQLGMRAIGFLDDDSNKIGKYLAGVRVLGAIDSLPDVVVAHRIDHVLIALPTASGSVVRDAVTNCRSVGVASQIVPGVFELLGGRVNLDRVRTVEITDLLRRAPVMGEANTAGVSGRTVLITGGGGSIGFELARQVANAGPARLVLLGHGENSLFDAEARLRTAFPMVPLQSVVADIRDEERVGWLFQTIKPEVVFHAAAHKHVPLMEGNPEEAVTNNVTGTRNIVRQALRADVKRLVLISTDKAVAPSSIMGATKRVAETLVRQAAKQSGRAFVVVRFGNVLGSRGSVVNTFKTQIEAGGPVTVTHPDMTRYFMTIPEAVHLVLQASGIGRGGELFVLNMGEPIRIVDLARDLISLSGFELEEIPVEFTGLRPGEKLHERLFEAEAQLVSTPHPDIFQVAGQEPSPEFDVEQLAVELDEAARRSDMVRVYELLKLSVPGFLPTSEFPRGPLSPEASRARAASNIPHTNRY